MVERQLIKLMVVVAISVLSVLAIAYPFHPAEWRKMLRVTPVRAPEPPPAAVLDRA